MKNDFCMTSEEVADAKRQASFDAGEQAYQDSRCRNVYHAADEIKKALHTADVAWVFGWLAAQARDCRGE